MYKICIVIDINERLAHRPRRKRDHATKHQLLERPLAKVLVEPTGAENGPIGTGVLHNPLATLGFFFTATRKQDQPLHAALYRQITKGADRGGSVIQKERI